MWKILEKVDFQEILRNFEEIKEVQEKFGRNFKQTLNKWISI